MLRLRLVHRCDASWDEMRGTAGARRCADCDEDVLDWTRLSEEEARAQLAAMPGRTACVRMNLDRLGRPAFATAVVAALSACGASPPPPATTLPPEPPREVAPVADIASSATTAPPEISGDDDADGIPNAVDACPTAPGRADDDPHKNGCPYLGVIVENPHLEVVDRVEFARAQAKVRPQSYPVIADVAALLATHPEIVEIEVEGHASPDEPSPQRLSEARARNVVATLVARGVDARRLVVTAYGTTRPSTGARTAEQRALERSVSFEVKTAP
jgi:outer membrane protein OmpA-like peptidoglycan-associated protein